MHACVKVSRYYLFKVILKIYIFTYISSEFYKLFITVERK